MALQPGSEAIPHDASPAFLAGHAHGTQMAAQHKAPAKPAAKPAAPSRKVAAPAQTLLQQAQAIAQAQTNAQVEAIRAQQDQYRQTAADRARQIQAASQASAGLLNGWDLGGQTASSYDNAAKTIAGLAQGFSGQTGVDASSAADQVRANLAALGAPADSAKTTTGQVSDPAALKNVLYGLGGFIPGNLLETSGQAAAAVQRGLPASALAYGQQQAAGTVAAGAQQADTLTPQLIDAQGKLPTLVQQALAGLSDQQQREFLNKLSVLKFNASQSSTAFNQKATVARINLESKRLAQAAYESDRTYAISLANLGIKQKNQQIALMAADAKYQNGGFTKVQANKFQTDAAFVISQAETAATGKPTFQQVMAQMLQRHVPISLATKAIEQWDPTLQGTPPSGALTKAYNQTVGVGQKASPFDVVNFAQGYLGVPYQWGGTTMKGLDCSAFVQSAYKRVGISIPRTTYAQVKQGRPVGLNQLQPGDLVFTEPGKNGPNHVGMYIGNGQVQESPHTGDVNKIVPLQSFLTGGFVAARRYLGG